MATVGRKKKLKARQADIGTVHGLALTMLKETGSHQLTALIQVGDGQKFAVLTLDGSDKDGARAALREAVSTTGSERYLVIAECWMTRAKPGDMPPILPSKTRNPEEVLLVEEYRKDQKNRSMITPFTRKGGKIVPGKTVRAGGRFSVSIWNVFLEKDGVEERMDRIRQEAYDKWRDKQAERLSRKYSGEFQKAKTDSERDAVLDRARAEIQTMKKELLKGEEK